MTPVETLPKAPITEAITEVKFVSKDGASKEEDFLSFYNAIRERFPHRKQQLKIVHQVSFQLGEEKSVIEKREMAGFRFESDDRKDIVQVRHDRLSVHRLTPYTNWAAYSATAKELLAAFAQIFPLSGVQRIGLRYLNRIELPLPVDDIRKFCLLFPETPPEVPQLWSNFLMRFSHKDRETNAQGTVTLTLDPDSAKSPALLPLILDIHAFYRYEAPVSPNSEELWQDAAKLRDVKNRIFFSC